MRNEAKRAAQEALFTAIKTSAETNMKAALRATEKAQILRELAEAYRLAAGSPVADLTARTESGANGSAQKPGSKDETARNGKPTNGSARKPKRRPTDDGEHDSGSADGARRKATSAR